MNTTCFTLSPLDYLPGLGSLQAGCVDILRLNSRLTSVYLSLSEAVRLVHGKHSASRASRKAIEMMMNRADADETASAFA
jgi:hypothetical protein